MDLIDRQAAIDAATYGNPQTAWQRIEALPSAQPERKKGKWIDYSDEGFVECPFCHSATNCDDNINELHFCFSCGAILEVQP